MKLNFNNRNERLISHVFARFNRSSRLCENYTNELKHIKIEKISTFLNNRIMSPFLTTYRAEFTSISSIFQRVTAFIALGILLTSTLNFNSLFSLNNFSVIYEIQTYFYNFETCYIISSLIFFLIFISTFHILNGYGRFILPLNFKRLKVLEIYIKKDMLITPTMVAFSITLLLISYVFLIKYWLFATFII